MRIIMVVLTAVSLSGCVSYRQYSKDMRIISQKFSEIDKSFANQENFDRQIIAELQKKKKK